MLSISKIKFSLIDLIVLFSYYLLCALLILGLFGWFNKILIGLILIPLILFLILFRKHISLPKKSLFFFIFVPVLCLGIFLFIGRYTGDATARWLPWIEATALQEKIPDLLLSTPFCFVYRMPLLILFSAAVFSVFGINPFFLNILIFFFVAATAFLIYDWAKEKTLPNKYLIFVVLLLFTNPVFFRYAWTIHQDIFLIFFTTAFFYYLEKYKKAKDNKLTNTKFYFFFMALSLVLAIASKFNALVLILVLVWFIFKNRYYKGVPILFYVSLPVLFWFIRNYLIYDTPFFIPYLNEFFAGKYSSVIEAVNEISKFSPDRTSVIPLFAESRILEGLITFSKSLFWMFCPLLILSIYGIWKEKKFSYLLLIILLLISASFIYSFNEPHTRQWLLVLGLLLVYGLIGLNYVKSRLFLSFIFFFNLWGLLNTTLYSSKSSFIGPVEKYLSPFYQISDFIHQHHFIFAFLLGLFFYLFISKQKSAKYLLFLLFASYLVKVGSIQLSWLNVWLPILFLILVTLIWNVVTRCLRKDFLYKLVVIYIIIFLVLNSWGLVALYYIFHKDFVFPRFPNLSFPEAIEEIKQIEGESKDFYIYAGFTHYLIWYHKYKTFNRRHYTFHLVTDVQYSKEMHSAELHQLFKESNIKYIIENVHKPFQRDFFDKVKERSDLFEVVSEKDGYYLWKVF